MSLFGNRIIREVDFGGVQLTVDLVTQTTAILGNRGGGKTTTAAVGCEGLMDLGQQIVVIDPLDGWPGLKSSADGKRAAYPVIVLGGYYGDLPLVPEAGAAVADFVVDEGASVVLSLRHFESQGDQRTFVTDFARRLFFRKGSVEKKTPVLVVIDEASIFVPQRVGAQEAPMVGAIQKLVRQGRSSGIGVMLIDQRPASVNKDVLSQIELLVTHRITNPHDQKALMTWVEQHDTEGRGETFKKSLPSLANGEAWFWSPAWMNLFKRVKVRPRKTFDTSATPRVGEVRREPEAKAEINLEALKERLSATIERAKEEDPRLLQARIKELEAELKKPRTAAPLPGQSSHKPLVREVLREVEIERVPAKLYSQLLEKWRLLVSKSARIKQQQEDLAVLIADLNAECTSLGALVEDARFKPVTSSANGRTHVHVEPTFDARKLESLVAARKPRVAEHKSSPRRDRKRCKAGPSRW